MAKTRVGVRPRPLLPTSLGFNYGYQFDGVDESINFGNVLDLSKNDAFSFSFWIRRISSGSFGIMGKSSTTGSNGVGWSFDTNGAGTQLNFYFQYSKTGNDRYYITTTAPTVGEWQNYTLTYDGSDSSNGFEWYIDGVLQTPILRGGSLVNDVSNSGDFRMGSGTLYAGHSNIRLDDVQFYNFELNATQVSEIYNNGYVKAPTASPIHHWKLGESDTWDGSNWTVVDEIGSLNGTSVNMEEADRKMGVAYSMSFDGVDEEILFPSTIGNFSASNPFSISIWCKNLTNTILGKYTGGVGYSLWTNGALVYFRFNSGGLSQIYADFNNFTNFNHIVIVYNGGGLNDPTNFRFFTNSIEKFASMGGAGVTGDITNGDNFRISSSNGFVSNGGGDKMELSIYDTELTATDVSNLYNSGVPVDPRDVSLTPSFFAPLGGPNDSFSTNWTCVDEINGNNGTSVNMEEVDKTSVTP